MPQPHPPMARRLPEADYQEALAGFRIAQRPHTEAHRAAIAIVDDVCLAIDDRRALAGRVDGGQQIELEPRLAMLATSSEAWPGAGRR